MMSYIWFSPFRIVLFKKCQNKIEQQDEKQHLSTSFNPTLKKLIITFLSCLLFSPNGFCQDAYKSPSHQSIGQYFMDGAFIAAPLMDDRMLLEYDQHTGPIYSGIYLTYYNLCKVMAGLKIDREETDEILEKIEEQIGCENTIYGLALILKAVAYNEDMDLLLNAASIIKETAGEDSWEHAFAIYIASSFAMDIDLSKCLEYAKLCLSILEGEHKDSWLYHLASANKGRARILLNDMDGEYDIRNPYQTLYKSSESIEINEYDIYWFPLLLITVNILTLSIDTDGPEVAINLGLAIFNDLYNDVWSNAWFKVSELCVAVNRTLCQAYAMKKDSEKAKFHYEIAEQVCIERFGKGSTEHTSLQQYRSLF